jgi:hypothetical protein
MRTSKLFTGHYVESNFLLYTLASDLLDVLEVHISHASDEERLELIQLQEHIQEIAKRKSQMPQNSYLESLETNGS